MFRIARAVLEIPNHSAIWGWQQEAVWRPARCQLLGSIDILSHYYQKLLTSATGRCGRSRAIAGSLARVPVGGGMEISFIMAIRPWQSEGAEGEVRQEKRVRIYLGGIGKREREWKLKSPRGREWVH